MQYVTIIAEKPSVAAEIAKVVGANEPHRDGPCGYLEGNGYRVTWAFGHLVTLRSPEEMGFEGNTLPILPESWPTRLRTVRGKDGKQKPDEGALKQMKTLKTLFEGCSEIIVATDAGREGELIFRYIYEYLGCRKPFRRLWISSLTEEAIEEGFRDLRPGSEYDGLSAAAHLRSQSDWLVGYNASRALRVATQYKGNLSLGRVQTPTLGMICERYLQNKNFKPTPFWKIILTTGGPGRWFKAVSEKNYPSEKAAREDAIRTDAAAMVNVKSVEKKRSVSKPPLLFDLTALQRAANSRYGFTAADTLSIAQSLYESKYITYPRTGSCYIPEDVFKTIPGLIRKVAGYERFAQAAAALEGVRLCRKSVDDSKVTDHHALLPTGIIPTGLGDRERKIWELVAGRLLESFGEDSLSDVTLVTLDGGGVNYKARGTALVKAGWKAVWGADAEEEKKKGNKNDDDEKEEDEFTSQGPLPELSEGERLKTGMTEIERRTDKPLPIYTDASLLAEMQTCGKRIEDEELREAMKEVGLGTPATRAATIEQLERRGYTHREGKKILPTPLGLQVWDMVKGRLVADINTTGEWERDLGLVETGKLDPYKFEKAIVEHTTDIIDDLKKNCRAIVDTAAVMPHQGAKCPLCGHPMKSVKNSVFCPADDGGCGFGVPFEILGKKLPESAVNALLQGRRTPIVKGFTSKKTGNKFDAALEIDRETRKVRLSFEEKKESAGLELTCPCCGETMADEKWDYTCGCGMKLPKSVCKKALTEDQLTRLSQGNKVFVKGMISSKGTKFEANLIVDTENRKIKFVFDK